MKPSEFHDLGKDTHPHKRSMPCLSFQFLYPEKHLAHCWSSNVGWTNKDVLKGSCLPSCFSSGKILEE